MMLAEGKMRVLRNNDTVKVVCVKCKSVLAAECSDVETSDIGHSHAHEFWVHCAVCGKENGLTRDDLPNHWLGAIFANNGIED